MGIRHNKICALVFGIRYHIFRRCAAISSSRVRASPIPLDSFSKRELPFDLVKNVEYLILQFIGYAHARVFDVYLHGLFLIRH
jgi:hypothetical protein